VSGLTYSRAEQIDLLWKRPQCIYGEFVLPPQCRIIVDLKRDA
jgi:hypothetical protein